MQKGIKKKQIEILLQQINDFELNNKQAWQLEQYCTSPDIAAQIFQIIYQKEEDMSSMIGGDFGSGTGMLMSGLLYLNIYQVIGFEIDKKYANSSFEQLQSIYQDNNNFDIINMDLKSYNPQMKTKIFDLIVMNPPFGTKNYGIDTIFLTKALQSCEGNIYSIHKTSTREFIQKFAQQNDRKWDLLGQFQFPLPKKFSKYHKLSMAYTEVDFICISQQN